MIEVMIASAIGLVVMLGALTFFQNQNKANNYVEFQGKREQLRLTLLGQFLNDPNNCKCLFGGATEFPVAGIAALTGVTPTQVGRYNFTTPGDCSTATLPAPFVTNAGVDGLRTTAIQLKKIVNISGTYQAEFTLALQSLKEVLGPKDILLTIPVAVATVAGTPGNVAFASCSSSTGGGGGGGSGPVGVCPAGLLSAGYDTSGVLVCQPPTYQ